MMFKAQLLISITMIYTILSIYVLCKIGSYRLAPKKTEIKFDIDRELLLSWLNQSVDTLHDVKSLEVMQNKDYLVIKRNSRIINKNESYKNNKSIHNNKKNKKQLGIVIKNVLHKSIKSWKNKQHRGLTRKFPGNQHDETHSKDKTKTTNFTEETYQQKLSSRKNNSIKSNESNGTLNVIKLIDWENLMKYNGSMMVPFSFDEKRFLTKCDNGEDYTDNLTPLMKKWHDLTEKYNIKYFLTAGSLMGSFLQGKPIDCDTDLDVLVDYRELNKLEKIQSKRNFPTMTEDNIGRLIMQADWRIEDDSKRRRFTCEGLQINFLDDSCSFQEPVGRFILNTYHLDIFPYHIKDGLITNLIKQRKMHLNDVFPRSKCELLGVQTYCPKDPKIFLNMHYGFEKLNFYRYHFERVRRIPNAFEKLKTQKNRV